MREPALLSRRAAAALPLAALVGAAPTTIAPPASAGTDTTLLDLGQRWDELLQELETFNTEFHAITDAEFARRSSDLDTESRRLSRLVSELFQTILAAPTSTAAGLAVKARILVRELEIDRDIDFGPGDLQSVERCAAEAEGMLDWATWGLLADVLRLAEKERTS